jgi:hypothetical protein
MPRDDDTQSFEPQRCCGGIEVAGGTDLSGLSVRYDLLGESG